jgi:hypothetical protein
MTVAVKKMSIAQSVDTASTAASEWIPAAGETVELIEFQPSGSPDLKGSITLYWDYGGANTIIWTSYGDWPFNGDRLESNSFAGNGTKKMALVLKNDSLQSANIAGAASFRVITA